MNGISTEEYLNKIRSRREKAGLPRCQRDEYLELFQARINADRIRDKVRKIEIGQLVKMFEGVSEGEMYLLFKECSAPGVKKFGGLLKHKLESGK